jgi:hypothetical protein
MVLIKSDSRDTHSRVVIPTITGTRPTMLNACPGLTKAINAPGYQSTVNVQLLLRACPRRVMVLYDKTQQPSEKGEGHPDNRHRSRAVEVNKWRCSEHPVLASTLPLSKDRFVVLGHAREWLSGTGRFAILVRGLLVAESDY